jgi:hypothetical protein
MQQLDKTLFSQTVSTVLNGQPPSCFHQLSTPPCSGFFLLCLLCGCWMLLPSLGSCLLVLICELVVLFDRQMAIVFPFGNEVNWAYSHVRVPQVDPVGGHDLHSRG